MSRYAVPLDSTINDAALALRAAHAEQLLALDASLPAEEQCSDARLVAVALLLGVTDWDPIALHGLTGELDLAAFLAQFTSPGAPGTARE